jgi:hypothetical protein
VAEGVDAVGPPDDGAAGVVADAGQVAGGVVGMAQGEVVGVADGVDAAGGAERGVSASTLAAARRVRACQPGPRRC